MEVRNEEQTGPVAGERAPDVVLRDETGGEVALSSYWAQAPAALLFVRHFG